MKPADLGCYFCGAPATSMEHVPPLTIFPKLKDSPDGKDYRRNLITVPSCDDHNSRKHKDDEYLWYVLILSLSSNDVAKSQFLTKMRRSIEQRPKLLDRTLGVRHEVFVRRPGSDVLEPTFAVRADERRLTTSFVHAAMGLYFHERQDRWTGKVRILNEFLISMNDFDDNVKRQHYASRLDEMLADHPRSGENPEVFNYQFLDLGDGAILRMHFYGLSRITAFMYKGSLPF